MHAFSNPKFTHQIVQLGNVFGGNRFWPENLMMGMNPRATWQALLYVGCSKQERYTPAIRRLLVHPNSRVRAWACFALSQLNDDRSVDQIRAMNADPSNRVRIHAWQALQVLVGPEQSQRPFPIRIPREELLVLVSEDSLMQQVWLGQILKHMGFNIIAAKSEPETLLLAYKFKPHAIITDNQKGRDNLSGISLTQQISRSKHLENCVLFMLTADFIEPVFLWSGGDYFLWKGGARREGIMEAVNEYLHH